MAKKEPVTLQRDPNTFQIEKFYMPLRGETCNTHIYYLRRFLEGFEVDLNPDYQRGYVWTQEQKENFVGHVLMGGNYPQIIVNDYGPTMNHKTEVVDGKQRIQAILDWVDNKVGARFLDGSLVYEKDLDAYNKNYVGRIHLQFLFCKHTDRKTVLELYIRLNTGGTVHTKDEIDRVRDLLKNEGGSL